MNAASYFKAGFSFSNRSDLLRQKTHYVDQIEYRRQLYSIRNTSNAYIVSRSRAAVILFLTNFDEPRFRLMRDTMECSLFGYRLPRSSPIRAAVDRANRRVQEAGLPDLYVKWSMRYVLSVYSNDKLPPPAGGYKPLDCAEFEGALLLYAMGMGGGLLLFGLEYLYFYALHFWY